MRVQSSAGVYAVATARRLPEQVDRAGSIARVPDSRKLEERRVLHINTVTRFDRRLRDTPIVTGGVEIRRLACSLSSRSNGEKGRFQPRGSSPSKPVRARETAKMSKYEIISDFKRSKKRERKGGKRRFLRLFTHFDRQPTQFSKNRAAHFASSLHTPSVRSALDCM